MPLAKAGKAALAETREPGDLPSPWSCADASAGGRRRKRSCVRAYPARSASAVRDDRDAFGGGMRLGAITGGVLVHLAATSVADALAQSVPLTFDVDITVPAPTAPPSDTASQGVVTGTQVLERPIY